MEKIINNVIDKHIQTINFLKGKTRVLEEIASVFISTIKNHGKIIFFGNGGSAADAQHLTAELIGRFKKKRKPLPAMALTTNTSVLTALGNDFGFDEIFAYQIEALADAKDVVVGISTSGDSGNVIKGIQKAKSKSIKTVGLLGKDGGDLKNMVDINLVIPEQETARIQEAHIVIGHLLCEIVEEEFFG